MNRAQSVDIEYTAELINMISMETCVKISLFSYSIALELYSTYVSTM